MSIVKKETGSAKKPQPAPPKKPTIPPVIKPAQPATPAPKQPIKPASANTPAQGGQVGTVKAKSQAAPVPAAKLPLPNAAPVTPTKPQLASGKPTPKPVSLRYEQELLNNPMLKKIDRKMKEHPDLFGAVLRGSDSLEKAFDKMFAMWGRDEEMDAKALACLKQTDNPLLQKAIFSKLRPMIPPGQTPPSTPDEYPPLILNTPGIWSDYEEIVDRLPQLRQLTERWNTEGLIPDDVFLTILIIAIHEEARLRRQNLHGEGLFNAFNQSIGSLKDSLGDWAATLPFDFPGFSDPSLGLANIRQSTVEGFMSDQIDIPPDRVDFIDPQLLRSRTGPNGEIILGVDFNPPSEEAAFALASIFDQYTVDPVATLMNESNSLELLAAQVFVASTRITVSQMEPTFANVAAYMNQGVQTSTEFDTLANRQNPWRLVFGDYDNLVDHIDRSILSAMSIGEYPQAFGLAQDPWFTFPIVGQGEYELLSLPAQIAVWDRYSIVPPWIED